MAKSGFKGRERVWQSYSKKLWPRMVKNCKAGLIEVRADLRWFHELFEAAPSIQQEIFGKAYPEVKQKLAPYGPLRIALLIIALVIGTYGAYEFAQVFFRENFVCWGFAAVSFILAIVVFTNHVKIAYEDPKDLPLVGVFILFFAIAAFLLQPSKILIVGVFFFLCSLLLANVELWVLRNCIIRLIGVDYEFFKQVSGRPNESNERPPLCFLKFVGEEQQPVAWDENANPTLPESITRVMNSIILGPRFDVFMPKGTAQFLVFVVAALIALSNNDLSYEKVGMWIGGAAFIMTLFSTYLCPSSYYAEYRQEVEREKRRTSEDQSEAVVQITWILKNTIWTSICVAFWTWLLYWMRFQMPTIFS